MSRKKNRKKSEDGLDAETFETLQYLIAINEELTNRSKKYNPIYYGLPDLFFPPCYSQGTLDAKGNIQRERIKKREGYGYKYRQRRCLKEFIENQLYAEKDGRKINLRLIKPQLDFLTDIFFGYQKFAICWKNRGGGGSLTVALIIWLMMVYHHVSFLDLAGSGEQAKNVYNYVVQFWNCFPSMKKELLDGEPLQSETKMKNNVKVKCLTASEKSARGKHERGLIIDEASQDNKKLNNIFQIAVNATMSEPDPVIILLSTFHNPVGFFQEYWDEYKKKGFSRYKWNIYQTLKKCTLGLDGRTPKEQRQDPKGLNYCQTQCELTEREEIIDEETGTIANIQFRGCNGTARDSNGFAPVETAFQAKKLNDRDTFRVEFECERPEYKGPVFGIQNIQKSLDENIKTIQGRLGVVGIDWGYVDEGAMALVQDHDDYMAATESIFLSQDRLPKWIDKLYEWNEKCGNLIIYADSSHPMCNREVLEEGFDLYQVVFQKVRDILEFNLKRYFNYRKIKIHKELQKLIFQLQAYRKDDAGRIVKSQDHGPDALELAFAHGPWDFKLRFHDFLQSILKQSIDEHNQDQDSSGDIKVNIF